MICLLRDEHAYACDNQVTTATLPLLSDQFSARYGRPALLSNRIEVSTNSLMTVHRLAITLRLSTLIRECPIPDA
jgi:hypothetical protein